MEDGIFLSSWMDFLFPCVEFLRGKKRSNSIWMRLKYIWKQNFHLDRKTMSWFNQRSIFKETTRWFSNLLLNFSFIAKSDWVSGGKKLNRKIIWWSNWFNLVRINRCYAENKRRRRQNSNRMQNVREVFDINWKFHLFNIRTFERVCRIFLPPLKYSWCFCSNETWNVPSIRQPLKLINSS